MAVTDIGAVEAVEAGELSLSTKPETEVVNVEAENARGRSKP